MSNLFTVETVPRIAMATSPDRSPFRMQHHTVVPSNHRGEDDEDDESASDS